MTSEPKNDADLESLVGQIADEFAERYARGETPQIEEYVLRYPEAGTALREVLATAEAMCSLSHADSKATSEGGRALPETLGDFRIVREIAHGGMGTVYEAEQVSLSRRVALKVLPFTALLDERQLQRFRIEAQAAACLHHTHIVPVHAVGRDGNTHFYAMQYIDGQSLSQVLAELRKTRGPTPAHEVQTDAYSANTAAVASPAALTHPATDSPAWFRQVARWGIDAAEALDYAHKQGIVHRDVKPGNLLIDGAGELWVTDFGLARRAGDANLTRTGDMIGTLRYMSPEQVLSQRPLIDHRSDVYALGATLYELLTLQPLFGGSDPGYLVRQITNDEPRSPTRLNKALPKDLETIVLKAIEKEPGKRYATAQFLADDLRRFLDDKPIAARPQSQAQRVVKWGRRHRAVVAVAAIGITAVGLVASIALITRARDRDVLRVQTTERVNRALQDASRLQGEAQQAEDDMSKWASALAAARQAEALATAGETSPELGQHVAALQAKLQRQANMANARVDEAERDRRALAAFEEARLEGTSTGSQDHWDYEACAKAYEHAFRDYGIDLANLTEGEASHLIRARSVRNELVVAALDWALFIRNRTDSQRLKLLQIAVAAAEDEPAWEKPLIEALATDDTDALRDGANSLRGAASSPAAIALLARGLVDRDLHDEAIALLSPAQRTYPADFWLNEILGVRLCETTHQQHRQALPFLMAAVALRPDSPGAYVNLGNALGETGQIEAAIAACKRALELRPNSSLAHNSLGKLLVDNGDLKAAIAEFQRALESRSGDEMAHNNLASALRANGELMGAISEYRQALALKPDFAKGHNDLGMALFEKGDVDGGVAEFRHAMLLKSDYADPHYNLGVALERKGLVDEGIAEYRRALELKSSYAEAHFNLGVLLGNKGLVDEAIAEYRLALELNPKDSAARNNLALALRRKGLPDEEIAELRRAVELRPDFAPAYTNLGGTLLHRGRVDEAIVEFRRAVELEPNVAVFHNNLVVALRQKGDYVEALEARKRFHQLGAGNPRWPYPTKQWVEEAEQLVRLDEKFPRILARSEQPGDAAEQVALAEFALVYKHRPMIAAGWYREALAADPALANDLRRGHRYNAACAAALAATVTKPDELRDDEREAWRNQAREWLTADLEAIRKLAENPQRKAQLIQTLSHWLKDPDLAGIRDAKRLQSLPETERQTFEAFWREVRRSSNGETVAAAERRLESASDNAIAHNDLAWILATCPEADLRDPQRAVKLAKRAVELAPQEGSHWNTLGVSQYRAGEWHAAIESLKKSTELLVGQHFSVNAFFLAMAYWQLDNKEEARNWFDQAVTWMEKNQPQNEELQRFHGEAVELLGIRESTEQPASNVVEPAGKSGMPD